METTIAFAPDETGSPGFGAALERVFGAARWVHNRAMIIQWEALKAGKQLPTLEELTSICIDGPAKDADTSWLAEIPRSVLSDELYELTLFTSDLAKFTSMRELPLKRKKDEQEMVYPAPDGNLVMEEDGLYLVLEKTGVLALDSDQEVPLGNQVEAVRIERTQHTMQYRATIFFKD